MMSQDSYTGSVERVWQRRTLTALAPIIRGHVDGGVVFAETVVGTTVTAGGGTFRFVISTFSIGVALASRAMKVTGASVTGASVTGAKA